MNTLNSHKSSLTACRFCKYYTPEGRRGGTCSILQSLVGGDWGACCMSAPIFGKSTSSKSPSKPHAGANWEHEFMIRASSVVCISD